MVEERGGTEPRVLAASGPGEIPEGLEEVVAVDHVDPVAHLEPTNERQYLIGGQIEGMEGKAERRVFDQRKEA